MLSFNLIFSKGMSYEYENLRHHTYWDLKSNFHFCLNDLKIIKHSI